MKISDISHICKKHGMTDHVLEKGGHKRCKKCRCEKVSKFRKRQKEKLVEYFGGKCKLCNYDACVAALHFHHIDPTTKLFGIAQGGMCKKWDTVIKEAEKCVLLCANCHAEVEFGFTDLSLIKEN